MKRLPSVMLAAAALASLASCTREERTPETQAAAEPAHSPAATARDVPPAELFGQWRLVSLTGQALPQSPTVHILIGHDRIEAASQCVPFSFSLAMEEGRVTIGDPMLSKSVLASAVEDPRSIPVCARTLSPVEQAFPRIMSAVRRVERRPGGRIALVGDRGEAVIERPAAAPTNPFSNTPGPGPWLMWGLWRAEEVRGEAPSGGPIELLFYSRTIEARSGCVAMLWRFAQEDGKLAVTPVRWPHAVCERGLSPAETALREILAGDVRIARSTPTERLLVGKAGSILLRR